MTQIALYRAPFSSAVTRAHVLRSTFSTGPFVFVAEVRVRDAYQNFITHYVDATAPSGDVWYMVHYFAPTDSGLVVKLVEVSEIEKGVPPVAVAIQHVIDTIQGITMTFVDARMVYRILRWVIAEVERKIRIALTPTQVIDEIHDHGDWRKIVGDKVGHPIQLYHFPVQSVDQVRYRLRGAATLTPLDLDGLDIQIESDGGGDRNRGQITIWPRLVSLQSLFAVYRYADGVATNAISLLFSYTHGLSVWPRPIEKLVVEATAASVMEIAGEADTAGLSSRSVDGYSETYTASATTTIFSARRMFYLKEAEEMLKHYRPALWG